MPDARVPCIALSGQPKAARPDEAPAAGNGAAHRAAVLADEASGAVAGWPRCRSGPETGSPFMHGLPGRAGSAAHGRGRAPDGCLGRGPVCQPLRHRPRSGALLRTGHCRAGPRHAEGPDNRRPFRGRSARASRAGGAAGAARGPGRVAPAEGAAAAGIL
ncbi:hypothetical protein Rsph17029_0734 [Rhodobacter sphaeroides ATCC 17029]|nr:hypothetical protein Rsph17029_0734 [Cereibacter sphaeroides ATCC 17029]